MSTPSEQNAQTAHPETQGTPAKRRRANDPARKAEQELTLPIAEETEAQILSIIFLNPDSLQKAIEAGLSWRFFNVPSHQILFRSLLDMQAKKWELSPPSLIAYLKAQHQLEKVGGPAFVTSLIDGRFSHPERMGGLINQLKDINFKRETVKKAIELQRIAGNGASPAEIEDFLDGFERTNTGTQSYAHSASGLFHRKPVRGGFGFDNVRLTNFGAKITRELIEDDGSGEEQRIFELQLTLKSEGRSVEVPASKFNSMGWATEMLGVEAIVYPGMGEHASCAIKSLSQGFTKQKAYAHTGWRQIEEDWVYLHAGGAITGQGNRTDVSVRLPGSMRNFVLPEPAKGKEVVAAYGTMIDFLDAFPHAITVPIGGIVVASVLGDPDYSGYLVGQSGSFKSELSALAMAFFGSGFKRVQLPANWNSTALSLIDLGFVMKDALCVVDDFAPNGQKRHDDDLHNKAETLFRAAGNRAGRGKLGVDHKQRNAREPRGLYLASGEDLPKGFSVQNRLMIIPVEKGQVTVENLSAQQKAAREGLFVKSMATFLSYMARDYSAIKSQFEKDCEKYRDQLTELMKNHARQPTMLAHMLAAWRVWLTAAHKEKALSKEAAKQQWDLIWKVLVTSSDTQKDHQVSMHPADHFFELLRSALLSGEAHLETIDGNEPPTISRLCGWRARVPAGKCVGWVDDDITYLEPRSAFNVANGEGIRGGEGIAVGQITLWKRLDERGLIVKKEKNRFNKCRVPVTGLPAIAVPTSEIFALEKEAQDDK